MSAFARIAEVASGRSKAILGLSIFTESLAPPTSF